MNSQDVLVFVKASAPIMGLDLDEARALRVASHLERTAQMAALLEELPLRPEDEPDEIYCPAPHEPGLTESPNGGRHG